MTINSTDRGKPKWPKKNLWRVIKELQNEMECHPHGSAERAYWAGRLGMAKQKLEYAREGVH